MCLAVGIILIGSTSLQAQFGPGSRVALFIPGILSGQELIQNHPITGFYRSPVHHLSFLSPSTLFTGMMETEPDDRDGMIS